MYKTNKKKFEVFILESKNKMDTMVYFESIKVSSYSTSFYNKTLQDKVDEIKDIVIERLSKEYSIEIDIKNNCIIKNNNE